uniref:VWFD domain-containing protein n=1 Tax=Scleropages formosus TaxID=113540 RepID=A0A8C9WPW3_SCLFO
FLEGSLYNILNKSKWSFTCKTYGSGITQPLTGEKFYVRSDCPFNFITFTHDKVDVIVTLTRGKSGLISRAVINVNNAKISLENGHIIVEDQSVSVPYNDMYRHIFQYGIYTKMKSKVLPAAFSILWQSFGNEITLSYMTNCFSDLDWTMTLCGHNVDGFEKRPEIYCPFFNEIAHNCLEFYSEISDWRIRTNCRE